MLRVNPQGTVDNNLEPDRFWVQGIPPTHTINGAHLTEQQ